MQNLRWPVPIILRSVHQANIGHGEAPQFQQVILTERRLTLLHPSEGRVQS